jgi:TatD DNase family protein
MIDSHCHLDGPKFASDFHAVLDRARAAGVTRLLAVGSGDGPPDLEAGIRLADSDPIFVASVGVHPHEAAKADDTTIPHLIALTAHPKIVAVGEIGLDYHYDFSPRETQRDLFVRQMEVAREAKLPILIHTREAWDDTFTLIEKHWDASFGGVFHCFSGGPAEAERALALGFHLGIGGW